MSHNHAYRICRRYLQELHGHCRYITNLPPQELEAANNGESLLDFKLLSAAPPLEVLSVSSYNPLDYDAFGDEQEERDVTQSILNACIYQDCRLAIQPQECDSWVWHQRIPEILRGQDPEWSLIGLDYDISGLGLIIAHRDPLPDGTARLEQLMVAARNIYLISVMTADGVTYTYIQSEKEKDDVPSDPIQHISVCYPDGCYEAIGVRASCLERYSTRLCVSHYDPE